MNIREFVYENDLQAVLKLWRGSRPGIRISPSDDPVEVRKKLQRDPDLFLVAEEDARIIGAVVGGFDGRRGMVYHLAVETIQRGRGFGRALMGELEVRLRRKGCLKYYLLVTKDNQDAVGFYQQIGCEVMDILILGKVIK